MVDLHHGYSDDAVENDDLMLSPISSPLPKVKRGAQPVKPPRKDSIPRSDDIPQINVRMDKGKV